MGLEPKFSRTDIRKYLDKRVRAIDQAIINRLILIGEQFVKNARENGAYNDITGNLRSSVGYVVLKDGRVLSKDIQQSGKGSDKKTGTNKAQEFANGVVSRFNRGYVLVGFAGMEYAAAVESRGKDVITSSANIAERDLKAAIKTIDKKLSS